MLSFCRALEQELKQSMVHADGEWSTPQELHECLCPLDNGINLLLKCGIVPCSWLECVRLASNDDFFSILLLRQDCQNPHSRFIHVQVGVCIGVMECQLEIAGDVILDSLKSLLALQRPHKCRPFVLQCTQWFSNGCQVIYEAGAVGHETEKAAELHQVCQSWCASD